MLYKEFLPPAYFSHHIECFWEMELTPPELDAACESLSPDCTFDILFTDRPFSIHGYAKGAWKNINPGGTFFGQKTSSVHFFTQKPVHIFGIRFKPFAFANLIKTPLSQLNDQVVPLDKLFDLTAGDRRVVQQISSGISGAEKTELAEGLILNLLKKTDSIDQSLREQLNYILDRKGLVKINQLFSEFGISKVTLLKRFSHKIGLSPKLVSRIWRINYFLELQKDKPSYNLTELCLETGFYDQAHFIKEFKSFFGACPHRFFQQENRLIKISQETITKRFSRQYDPR